MKKSYHYPRPITIVHYLLPLVNQFLCSQKYSAKNSLVDAAIDVRYICLLIVIIIRYNVHYYIFIVFFL